MPKTPQDRKPKDAAYSFTVTDDGKARTYHLPAAETAVPKLSGRFLRDAYMDGEEGEMRLGFAMLEAVDADEGALDALYEIAHSGDARAPKGVDGPQGVRG